MEKLEFIVPEGYEVKEENGKYFAVKKEREKEWSEFGLISGAFVDQDCEVIDLKNFDSTPSDRNIFPTTKEANAYGLVMPQLLQWRDKVNGDWKPDWNNRKQTKWSIIQKANKITVATFYTTYTPLTFETGQKAEQFYKDHKTLLDQLIL